MTGFSLADDPHGTPALDNLAVAADFLYRGPDFHLRLQIFK